MLTLISRIVGSLVIGVCLSSYTMIFLTLIFSIRNLPRAFSGIQRLLRRFLRFSFQIYAFLLRRLRPLFYDLAGIDITTTIPRTIFTTLLSLVIGVGILLLLNFPIPIWLIAMFTIHGLFVGLAWKEIVTPGEFQFGAQVE